MSAVSNKVEITSRAIASIMQGLLKIGIHLDEIFLLRYRQDISTIHERHYHERLS
jgi:hypothetical protein